jgi:hypothetical protein
MVGPHRSLRAMRSDHTKSGNSVEERIWNCQEQTLYLLEADGERGLSGNLGLPSAPGGMTNQKMQAIMRSDQSMDSGQAASLEHADVEMLISQLYRLRNADRGEAPGHLCRKKQMAPPTSS